MAKSESTKIEFGYFHDYESEQFAFYRIPKVLFTDEYFRNLSSDAKVLYGLMLDRMALSIRNNWVDNEGKVYIIFTLEQVMEYMNCGKDKGVKILAAEVDGVDMNGLRDLGDQLKEKLGEGVVVLASGNDGKVSLMVTATDAAMKQGAHAGNLVKAIAGLVGGGGGGRPNMAQAGGKNQAGIQEALKKAAEALEGQLS